MNSVLFVSREVAQWSLSSKAELKFSQIVVLLYSWILMVMENSLSWRKMTKAVILVSQQVDRDNVSNIFDFDWDK